MSVFDFDDIYRAGSNLIGGTGPYEKLLELYPDSFEIRYGSEDEMWSTLYAEENYNIPIVFIVKWGEEAVHFVFLWRMQAHCPYILYEDIDGVTQNRILGRQRLYREPDSWCQTVTFVRLLFHLGLLHLLQNFKLPLEVEVAFRTNQKCTSVQLDELDDFWSNAQIAIIRWCWPPSKRFSKKELAESMGVRVNEISTQFYKDVISYFYG